MNLCFLSRTRAVCLAATVLLLSSTVYAEDKNILFIGIDDMQVAAGCYGQSMMKTPQMDRLASKGMVFMNAYVQQAVCAASRASLLTGCRPDTTGVNYPYTPWFITTFVKKHPTIADSFSKQGFYTRTLGKIHHGFPIENSFTEAHYSPEAGFFALKENQRDDPKKKHQNLNNPWEHADLPDNAYMDGQIADETIATIRRAVKSGKSFFIAPGFKKPHLPFVCPKEYSDLYQESDIKLSPHPELGPDQDPISIAKNGAYNWLNYREEGINNENARQLRHSYYACVSFVDAQIGKILDELDQLGIADNTVIMIWSDHGYHLGDHGAWGKSSNFELATRSPLIVYDPGMKGGGKKTAALVEFVDMYPTLLELAEQNIPDYLEGTSFAAILNDPDKEWKKAAFSQFPRGGDNEGYTIRTSEWRYTEWRSKKVGKPLFVELYHCAKDPIETRNLAEDPKHKNRLKQMKNRLEKGWKNALPPGITNRSNNPRGVDSFYTLPKDNRTIELKKITERLKETSKNRTVISK